MEQEKKDNLILKKLLSQDEDGEPPTIMDQEISSSPHPSTAASSSGDRDKDKNEAEPKKTNNVLLKVRQGGVLCLWCVCVCAYIVCVCAFCVCM